MRLLNLILILLLFSVQAVYGQPKKIDSLENVLRHYAPTQDAYTSDTIKINLLVNLAWERTKYDSSLERSIDNAKQALDLANKIKWNKGKVAAYSCMARAYRFQENYGLAIETYKKALDISKEVNEQAWIAKYLFTIGEVYHDDANYPEALDYFLQSLKCNEDAGIDSRVGYDLTMIGIVYQEIDDNENALKYELEALKKHQQYKDKYWTAMTLQVIAIVYDLQNEYDKALDYYSQILNMQKGNIYSTSLTLLNIGNVYMNQSNTTPLSQPDTAWDKAMDHYSRSFKMSEETNNSYQQGVALTRIGFLYLKRNKIKEADIALSKAIDLVKQRDDLPVLKDLYFALTKLDSIKGNWKRAFEYQQRLTAINDSILDKKKSQQIARLQVKYITDKKQAEIAVLNKDNELKGIRIERQQKNILLIIAITIILLLGAGGFIYYRNKKIKQEALKQISEAKLASLKSLMDKHFIFSSLHSIDTFLMNNDSEAASDYLVKYSKLIRSILEMSNQAEVSLEEELSLCRSYLDLEKIRLDNFFDYEFSIDGTIAMQQTLFPSMLLQPLVENAVKHGIGSLREEGKKGLINVDIKREKDKLICSVTDNGKGLQFSGNESKTHRSYSGKGIIERVRVYNSLRKNKASFLLKDNNLGVTAVLTLPYLLRKQSIAV